jgi:hypothetical protein
MEREAMSCEVVREALPLLTGSDDSEAARVRTHVADCASCQELMESYQADEAALSALRAAQSDVPAGIMDGFSQGILDRIAHESAARPRGEVVAFEDVRRSNLRWLAAAAAVLLAVTTAVVSRSSLEATPQPVVAEQAVEPTASPEPMQLASDPLAPLPAPSVRDDAPMPARRVNRAAPADVMPAGGGRPSMGAGNADLEELMRQALPGLQRFFQPPQRPAERDDEVSF